MKLGNMFFIVWLASMLILMFGQMSGIKYVETLGFILSGIICGAAFAKINQYENQLKWIETKF